MDSSPEMPEPELETSFWIPDPRSPSLESKPPSESELLKFCTLPVSLEKVSPREESFFTTLTTSFTTEPTLEMPLPRPFRKSEFRVSPSLLIEPPKELTLEPS